MVPDSGAGHVPGGGGVYLVGREATYPPWYREAYGRYTPPGIYTTLLPWVHHPPAALPVPTPALTRRDVTELWAQKGNNPWVRRV